MKGRRRRSGDLRTAFDAISAPSAAFDVLSFAGSSEPIGRMLYDHLLLIHTSLSVNCTRLSSGGGEGAATQSQPTQEISWLFACTNIEEGGAADERVGRFTVNWTRGSFSVTKGLLTDSWDNWLYQRCTLCPLSL